MAGQVRGDNPGDRQAVRRVGVGAVEDTDGGPGGAERGERGQVDRGGRVVGPAAPAGEEQVPPAVEGALDENPLAWPGCPVPWMREGRRMLTGIPDRGGRVPRPPCWRRILRASGSRCPMAAGWAAVRRPGRRSRAARRSWSDIPARRRRPLCWRSNTSEPVAVRKGRSIRACPTVYPMQSITASAPGRRSSCRSATAYRSETSEPDSPPPAAPAGNGRPSRPVKVTCQPSEASLAATAAPTSPFPPSTIARAPSQPS